MLRGWEIFFRILKKDLIRLQNTLSMCVYNYSYKWSLDQSVNVWSNYFMSGNTRGMKAVTNTSGSGIG